MPHFKSCITLCLSWVLVLASLSPVFSQTPQKPTPVLQDDVLRISTDLVQTDVVVLDKKGRPVKGLTKDQFELLVDGQPQPISFFESVESGSTREAVQLAAARDLGPGPVNPASTNSSRPATLAPPMAGRTFIFFVDDFHLSPEGVQRTSDLLNNFVGQMGEDDRALIMSPSGQIGFLQQLTDHKGALKLAVSRIKYQSQAAPVSTQRRPMTVYEALAIERNQRDVIEYKTREYMDDMGISRAPAGPLRSSAPGNLEAPRPSGTDLQARMQTAEVAIKAEARNIMLHNNNVTEALLGALEFVARGAATLPGRKLFFFISDGFILDTRDAKATARLDRVIDTAARSGVAIYTVDSKGLTAGNISASQDTFSDIAIGSTSGPAHEPGTDSSTIARSTDVALKDILRTIASSTGGRAILNRNDLESGVKQILEETESYYVVAWKPLAIEAGKPKFSTLKVTVKGQPDLKVLARRGFYTTPPPPIPEGTTKAAAKDSKGVALKPSEMELRAAITGAFPRRQLGLSTFTSYSNETGATNKIITFADISNFQVTPGAGAKAGEVDFYVTLLDSTGKSVTSVGQKISIGETSPQPFRVVTTLPNQLPPGLYQARVAARDAQSGRVGSSFQWIDVPKFEPGKLTLGSLLLAEITGKPGETPSLDVDRRFARTSSMLIQMFVYNAKAAASGSPDVTVTLKVMQNGSQLVAAPPQPVSTAGVTDMTRLQYGAEIPLSGFPPGRYVLSVTANDRAANTSASQQINFTIE